MQKTSYIKLDEVYEIPIENLAWVGVDGRQYELQSKSWDKMRNYIDERNLGAA